VTPTRAQLRPRFAGSEAGFARCAASQRGSSSVLGGVPPPEKWLRHFSPPHALRAWLERLIFIRGHETRSSAVRSRVSSLVARLLEPVDVAWLAAFRVLYGVALAVSLWRFIANGWVQRFFVEPAFHFKYWGFEWVEALSGPAMTWLFPALIALSLAVAAGFAFRFTAPAFALGLTYVQLIDVSTYLNHYYLAALLGWLLALSPAHRAWSIDAWLGARFRRCAPRNRPPAMTRAWLYLFRFQVGVVYVFAGLAKAQPDWLLHAQPLRIWLGANTELPVVGPLFALPGVPLAMAWCGFFFDTTITGFLLSRRTRSWAFSALIVFHALTRLLFPIGMFPVIMTIGALSFFSPSWPRQWLARFGVRRAGARVVPEFAGVSSPGFVHRAGLALAALVVAVELALPLRSLAYGGNVLWHEHGMRFSWRVMLRAKGGATTFIVKDPATGRVAHVSPGVYLTGLQESEMTSQPDLVVQLARHIHDDLARHGHGSVAVHAASRVSLNGRKSAPFIDPTVDLARVERSLDLRRIVLPAPSEAPPHTRPVL
jgi:vitamin K-dependent gamma-carboxylase